MVFKSGFLGGALIGLLIFFIASTTSTNENVPINISGLSNVAITLIAIIALIITPIVIYYPKSLDTSWKGFFVGFPWSIALLTIIVTSLINQGLLK